MSSAKYVMAIYPNGVGFGYAVMENPLTPIDCGVVSVKPISNKGCLNKVEKLIDEYMPEIVLTQRLTGKHSKKTKRVTKLIEQIISLSEDKDVSVATYSREQIRFVFSEFQAKNRYEVAKKITEAIPQYKHKLPKRRKAWMSDGHTMGMFDAISLVMTHSYLSE